MAPVKDAQTMKPTDGAVAAGSNIAVRVQRCLDTFKSLLHHGSDGLVVDNQTRLANEYDRFKIWAANLGAHRPRGPRSLEYKLRDSQGLRSKVLELLESLDQTLQRLCSDRSEVTEDNDSEDDAGSFEYDNLADEPGDPLGDVHDMIGLMYHFSIALQNPAGDDWIKEGPLTITDHDSPYYIEHVRYKYPHAERYLTQRLGKACSARRQYCTYRRDHHERIAAGLDNEGEDGAMEDDPHNAGEFDPAAWEDDDVVSIASITSFATSEEETGRLRPPPFPQAGRGGIPFECPICYTIQVCVRERTWRAHAFEDITPYLCTIEDCRTPHQQFAARADWQMHVEKEHHSIYECPAGCESRFDLAADLEDHLVEAHGYNNDGKTLQRISASAARASDEPQDLHCPLCGKESASVKKHFRHVGRHLEQLAFFCLPSELMTVGVYTDEDGSSEEMTEQENRNCGQASRWRKT